MPPTIGGVRIDPQGQTLTVTITPSAKVYTDAAGTTLASFPATITTQTSYYVSAAQQFTVSCKNPQGVEIADGYGNALVMDIQQGVMEGIAPVLNQPGPEQVTQFGTYAPRQHMPTTPVPFAAGSTPNGTSPYRMVGWDPVDNRAYFVNNAKTNLYQSDDGEVSWQAKSVPSGVTTSASNTFERLCIVRFQGKIYGIFHETASGVRKLYRATPASGAGALTWEGPLFALQTGADGYPTNLDAAPDGSCMLMGEYGDPLNGSSQKAPQIYRSTDGSTWTAVYTGTLGVARHIHSVAFDPYKVGDAWACIGDGGATPIIIHSTDFGQTWSTVTQAVGWQSVQISFSPNYVWFASDQDGVALNVWDRAAGALKVGSLGNHAGIAVPDALQEGAVFRDGNTNTTNGNLGSNSAAFVAGDVGLAVVGQGIPSGATISSVTNGTTAVLSATPTEARVGNQMSFRIKRATTGFTTPDTFFSKAWYGAVDPATEVYYFVSNSSTIGSRQGIFMVPKIGAAPVLIESVPWNVNAEGRLYFLNKPTLGGYFIRVGMRAVARPMFD